MQLFIRWEFPGITAGDGLPQVPRKVPTFWHRRPEIQTPGFLKPRHSWSMWQSF